MNRTEMDLPPELAEVVRGTAAAAPPIVSDIGPVRIRARILRRRRTTVRATLAAVVVLVLGSSVPLAPVIRARLAPDVAAGGLAGPVPIPLWPTGSPPDIAHYPAMAGIFTAQLRETHGRNAVIEPGGEYLPTALPDGAYSGEAPLAGGDYVTIQKAGWLATAVAHRIFVVDVAGRIISSHPYPADLDPSMLVLRPMTGNATTVYWWGSQRTGAQVRTVLVRYEVANGAYQLLSPSIAGAGTVLPYYGMQATDTRIISWPAIGGSTCSADITDTTGHQVGVLRPAITGCSGAYFALSPDNKRVAALVTDRTGGTWSERVFVIDVRTGKIIKRVDTPALAAGDGRGGLISGLDWAGDHTIRYGRGELGTGEDALLVTIKV